MEIISTKLYMPPLRPTMVLRPRLTSRMEGGRHRKLTLVSAAAGFGKTTVVCEWLSGLSIPIAWLSIDEGDNDTFQFIAYLTAALKQAGVPIGEGLFGLLRSSERPLMEPLLTILLNEIEMFPASLILVIDDYHIIREEAIHNHVAFLLDRIPSHMHVVLITREEPHLPLSQLRVRDQLNEIRVNDLRFLLSEASNFLIDVMGLHLSSGMIETLETRTEGWIAGLQLAGISMQDHADVEGFVGSFNGSHRYVLDYLLEEVLQKQSDAIQRFLLQTSILDRFCGPLCDAVTGMNNGSELLEVLERSNLFVIPLDNDRNWYRYHHLFRESLRKRLTSNNSPEELHRRASIWYEDNGLETDALQHASAGGDVDRAARLIEGNGMPLHFRGAAFPVWSWLKSQPAELFDKRPALWVIYASVLLTVGRLPAVDEKLMAAEAALQHYDQQEEGIRDLVGHIASIRASLAVTRHDADTIMIESRRALDLLDARNLPVRTATTWALGYGYGLKKDRIEAERAYREAIASSEAIGHQLIAVLSTLGLGQIYEVNSRLSLARDTYKRVITLAGNPPLPVACEAYLGLGRIYYEWNELEIAEGYGRHMLRLAQQVESSDRVMAGELFLVQIRLARGDKHGVSEMLNRLEKDAHTLRRENLIPLIDDVRMKMMFMEGNLSAGVDLAEDLMPEDRIRALLLQSVTSVVMGEVSDALVPFSEALSLAAPERYIRSFLDLGEPMARLLDEAQLCGIMSEHTAMLLAEYPTKLRRTKSSRVLVEPLSKRELEILLLIYQGYSNEEIAKELFLALSTVKGYNRNIFDKLHVRRRTEAVALARNLGLIK
ncbi:HTH-type transcriptional regulator MalT [Paenibacillus plantiphilus]|uniref:HTH-type transcriptional regulator MalT n=1 Tax=Paenibacillus plantiphilus TaxID=2905650 RepID=A0ABM9C3V8_9BACL|nr:LuxR C-terminal-related transcriptional regulator [Paenibacillus plantiphilus]CAH1200657.1 HTH-type transcriptional regulator MalT [Paenibacillus plantiphilus]